MPTTTAKQNGARQRGRKTFVPAVEKQYQRLLNRALAKLDGDDFAGFWEGMDTLNTFVQMAVEQSPE